MKGTKRIKTRFFGVTAAAAVLLTGTLLQGCSGSAASATNDATTSPQSTAATAAATTAPASPTAAPADLKLLKIAPDNGSAGTSFAITGENLPAGKSFDVSWATVDGSYNLTATAENVQFLGKIYKEKRLSLGTGTVGSDGKVNVSVAAPDDFGEVHDVFLRIDGQDTARGGFRILRKVTVSPESGPIGTPITVTVTGLSFSPYSSVVAIRYDNMSTGILTATTTRGTTQAVIRASGKTGKHVIDIDHASRSVPYLNNQQSGTANIPDWRFWFTVTDDSTLPPNTLDWPDPAQVSGPSTAVPRTTIGDAPLNSNASISPAAGPILSKATVTVTGMAPNAAAELFWVTAHGNRVSQSGWSLSDTSIGKATVGSDGKLTASVDIPDDLGGWHEIKVASNNAVVAQIPFFVEHSLAGVTPQKVKAGTVFTVHLKGIGWTELDNGVAATYDNSYIGFACGFNSQGDVTMNLVATGEPGIHLIDLYPMIYQGHGEAPWGYEWPLLSFKVDAPGLALGYNLPAFRLAIEVTN